jgi:hypothetical protein
MSRGEKLGLPFTTGMVLYKRISRENGLAFGTMTTFLDRFAAIDTDKDGWIMPDDMARFLSVPNDASLQTLFWTAEKVSTLKASLRPCNRSSDPIQ